MCVDIAELRVTFILSGLAFFYYCLLQLCHVSRIGLRQIVQKILPAPDDSGLRETYRYTAETGKQQSRCERPLLTKAGIGLLMGVSPMNIIETRCSTFVPRLLASKVGHHI